MRRLITLTWVCVAALACRDADSRGSSVENATGARIRTSWVRETIAHGVDGTVTHATTDRRRTTTVVTPARSWTRGLEGTAADPDSQGSIDSIPRGVKTAADCAGPGCPSFVFSYAAKGGEKKQLVYRSPQVSVQVARNQLKGSVHSGGSAYFWEHYSLGYDLEKNAMAFSARLKRHYPRLDDGENDPEPYMTDLKYDDSRCDASQKASDQPKGFFVRFSCAGEQEFEGELFVPDANVIPTADPIR